MCLSTTYIFYTWLGSAYTSVYQVVKGIEIKPNISDEIDFDSHYIPIQIEETNILIFWPQLFDLINLDSTWLTFDYDFFITLSSTTSSWPI